MIELTIEEAISLLKSISRFEGFLYGLSSIPTDVIESELEYPVELLTKKLSELS
jgi:hypothetical protein